jgi:hypothetical protein
MDSPCLDPVCNKVPRENKSEALPQLQSARDMLQDQAGRRTAIVLDQILEVLMSINVSFCLFNDTFDKSNI